MILNSNAFITHSNLRLSSFYSLVPHFSDLIWVLQLAREWCLIFSLFGRNNLPKLLFQEFLRHRFFGPGLPTENEKERKTDKESRKNDLLPSSDLQNSRPEQ
jgi:hypothetical protein